MANFSKNPQTVLDENRKWGYLGVRIEQGVPVLDRDLNLRSELPAEAFRACIGTYIGSGTPPGPADQFKITALDAPANDFKINPGTLLVRGVEVELKNALTYSAQSALHPGLVPPLEPLAVPLGQRTDIVYIDVWFDQIDSATDPALYHPDEYELETSVRLKPNWVVRVAEGPDPVPAPLAGHRHLTLAQIVRQGGENDIIADWITDLRMTDLGMTAQAAQLTEAMALSDQLCECLAPRFHAEPFSSPTGHAGMTLQIRGSNLDFGAVSVEFGVLPAEALDLAPQAPPAGQQSGQGQYSWPSGGGWSGGSIDWQSFFQSLAQNYAALTEAMAAKMTWTPAAIAEDLRSDVLTVWIPPGLQGHAHVAVTNSAGRTYAPKPILIYWAPVWSPPGSQFSTYRGQPAYINGKLALMGKYFDLPGTSVEYTLVGKDQWIAATVTDTSALGCVVTCPKDEGEYRYRVTTFGGSATSTDSIKVRKP